MRNLLGTTAARHGRAHAQRGRRVRPQPGRQQQPLLPGQRDVLVRLGPRTLAAGPAGRPPASSPACARSTPCCGSARFFTGREVHEDGTTDLAWFGSDGEEMQHGRWENPATRTLQMLLNGAWLGEQSVLVVLHGEAAPGKVTLPEGPGHAAYQLLWDSTDERPGAPGRHRPPRSGRDRAGQHPRLPRRRAGLSDAARQCTVASSAPTPTNRPPNTRPSRRRPRSSCVRRRSPRVRRTRRRTT